MKYTKDVTTGDLTIPAFILKDTTLQGKPLDLHGAQNLAVIFPSQMDARTLLGVYEAIQSMSAHLMDTLLDYCDDLESENTEEACNAILPDWVREEMGIAPDSQVEWCRDEDTGKIHLREVPNTHELEDIPADILDHMIDLGMCLPELRLCLKRGDIVYGN